MDLTKALHKIIKKTDIKILHYNPQEITKYEYDRLKEKLDVRLKTKINFSQQKRIIKNSDEIKKLKKAVQIGKKAFKEFAEILQTSDNLDEKGLSFLAQRVLRDTGRYDLSFEPIIAIDANSAKPHAFAGLDRLKKDSIILLDAGVKFERYCSDRTRVGEFNKNISFSKSQNFKDKRVQKIYDLVLKAHDKAIEAVKIGKKAKDIDKIARDVIEKGGYGKEFVHSTGHGVGLDIHELPIISKRDDTILKEGMVFTIEPGIYLPNEFGIRVEDMLVVTKNGAEVL